MLPAALPVLAERPAAADPPARRVPVIAWDAIALVVLGGVLLAFCWNIVSDPVLRWDFRAFYASAQAWGAGVDPYDPRVLAPFLRDKGHLNYVYPPDTLWVFRALNVFPVDAASGIYLLIQLGLAAALYALWRRSFLSREDSVNPWFAAFCLFGLGGALLLDLRAGNISLIEQIFLWAGFAAYLRGRLDAFCVLLWLAASFKLTLLAFSGLLLLGPVRHGGKFALVWAAMAGRLALDYLVNPGLFMGFVHALSRMSASRHEGGWNNPCLPEMLKDLVRFSLGPDDEGLVRIVAWVLYALVAVAVLMLTWRTWHAVARRGPEDRHERGVLLVCLACLAYALVVPRLKDYSCILLLVPVWRLAKFSLAGKPGGWLALVVVACLSNHSEWFGLNSAYTFLWRYQSLALTFVVWALFLHEIWTTRASARAASTRLG